MKKMKFISFVMGITILISCNPEIPVTWEEPGAQWRGYVTNHPSQIGQTVVNCCDPGSNCATRGVREVQPFPSALRTSIMNDNIAAYFLTQDWKSSLPELIPYPSIVEYIKSENPRTKIMPDGYGAEAIVIYKDRNQPELGSDNILFALRLAPGGVGLPCPGQAN